MSLSDLSFIPLLIEDICGKLVPILLYMFKEMNHVCLNNEVDLNAIKVKRAEPAVLKNWSLQWGYHNKMVKKH